MKIVGGWCLLALGVMLEVATVGLVLATIWFTDSAARGLGSRLSDTAVITFTLGIGLAFAGCMCEPWKRAS